MSKDRIHFIPLESDPSIFTNLIHALGVRSLQFHDVLSLNVEDLAPSGSLALPGPVYALILIFPTTEVYEADLAAKKRLAHVQGTNYAGHGSKEPVIWFEQTIHNACGLYAILHAIANLGRAAATHIDPDSLFGTFLETCIPLDPEQRAKALETSLPIADAYRQAATQGATAVPNAEDEVNFHYVCFVQSPLNGHIYDMDGDKNGPLDGLSGDHDMLSGGLKLVKSYIQDENQQFQLMALVPTS